MDEVETAGARATALPPTHSATARFAGMIPTGNLPFGDCVCVIRHAPYDI
jgi:hypothetical protein